ncbi:ATP-binding protein [Herbidospora sp. NBRC 101105]|uniref:AAA family ATPase n=1 Tax=Herbidospora sp. NBRC 101105 TaxID=3032195 RepID=UPI0024A5671D|nr:ATP-binding protein [Herbidospora sp. NBRC 101105]GLX92717.1 ATPase [Herbidospora sp. NBRC 101105]
MTSIDSHDARALAQSLRRVYEAVAGRVSEDNASSPLVAKVTGHLGRPLSELVVVEEKYRLFEHAGLQLAADRYLAAHTPDAGWFGVVGSDRRFMSMINMITSALTHGGTLLGRADYTVAAVGPDETIDVVQLGLVCTHAPDGAPVVLGVNTREDFTEASVLTVIAADRETATGVRQEVDRLMRELDPLRGRVVTFGFSEHRRNELLTFVPRAELAPEEVVLPEGRLEALEEHVVGIGRQGDRLREAGQHLRRGLLLYGPPGTGKTHTVRYLLGRRPESTAILMTAEGMAKIGFAVALARKLQPSIVVVEDVDLIAEDRSHFQTSPLLFSLLDAMDGVAGDADVTFLLTTNRVEALETALVQRPGRIDLAVEIPPPDARARERLVRLYTRDRPVEADVAAIVAATEGVTASYIKELLRRVVLTALRRDEHALTDAHFAEVLDRMADDGESLTRALLGGAAKPGEVRAKARLEPPAC